MASKFTPKKLEQEDAGDVMMSVGVKDSLTHRGWAVNCNAELGRNRVRNWFISVLPVQWVSGSYKPNVDSE